MGMRAVSPHPLPAPGGRGEVGESHHFDRMGMRERDRSDMHYLTTGSVILQEVPHPMGEPYFIHGVLIFLASLASWRFKCCFEVKSKKPAAAGYVSAHKAKTPLK